MQSLCAQTAITNLHPDENSDKWSDSAQAYSYSPDVDNDRDGLSAL
jgi:hypothetical protein